MWEMFFVAKKIASDLWISDWYKLVVNTWDYQEVPHIHMHLISKRG
jgi:diadenosine tetraphosphate (Ap4A) HIT family hydrolase